jgi:hypothetical protein
VSGRTWLLAVWFVLGSTLAACSSSPGKSPAVDGAAGKDASGASGAAGTAGTAAGTAGSAGSDGGRDAMSEADTAPSTDGPHDMAVEKCLPILCQTAGGNYCGSFPDGCGGVVMCGNDCPTGQTCGGGGTAHLCGGDPNCKPISCSGPGFQFCGTIGDGCNNALSCPDCTAPKTCGGGGTAHVCGM